VGPVLVHANSLTTFAEAAVARHAGIPTVFHVHEMVAPTPKGRLAAALARRVASELVAVSEASAAPLREGSGSVRIVYEGAPAPPPPEPRQRDRPQVVVGTVGVISRRKGSDVFVDAAGLVRRQSDDVDFRMIGAPTDPLDAAWAEAVLRRAREAGIAHEPRAPVLDAIREWDVFALPSRRDPFPISLLEAMGAGLAIIGADVDGIPEQLTPGCGLLVEPESPRALADAILELARCPDRRMELGAAARRRFLERFTIPRQAEGLDGAYLAALDRERWARASS
jgi:glycosyltransferase involved in cell wall biosynthesis